MKKFTSFISFLLLSFNVSADSDGYYCSTEDYLAYQFSYSKEPYDKHVLYVINFSNISKTKEFYIPMKQIHGMRCTTDKIELLTFKSIISVSLNKPDFEEIKFVKGKKPNDFERTANLSIWQKFISESNASENTVQLSEKYNINLITTRTIQGCKHQISTYIVNKEQKAQLFSGERMLYCGG